MSADSTSDVSYAERARKILGFSRWWQLVAATAMMAAVSPYQYVWSSIQQPLAARLGIALPALGAVFSLYVVFQSLSQFPAGWWRDRRGPRLLTGVAALLAGGGYIGLAYATSLWHLYVLYSLGSVGVGIIYTVAVNTAVKWFPDRRGLTTGVGTMAFAAGSVVVVPYVRANATTAEYPSVLRNVGVLILVILLAGAFLLRDPPGDWERSSFDSDDDHRGYDLPDASGTEKQYSWREMVGTWQFWLLYAMFIAISGADLLVIAQIVDFAEALGFTALVATLSATLLPLASGVSRIVLGQLSDYFNRKHVMAASFLLAGVFRLLMVFAGFEGLEVLFVSMVILAMFFSSPLYVLFPSILGDYYGTEFSSENYAILYTAKIGGGIFSGAIAGALIALAGWTTTFVLGGVAAIATGVAATLLRKPTP